MDEDNGPIPFPYTYDSEESIVGERRPTNMTPLRLRHLALNANGLALTKQYFSGTIENLSDIQRIQLVFMLSINNVINEMTNREDSLDSESTLLSSS